jgi:hypothetical protein
MQLSIAAIRPIKWAGGVAVATAILAASTAASAQSSSELMAMRRCNGELDFMIARDAGGRNPETVVDDRRQQIRQTSTSEFEISGPGRYMRDANDRGRDFTYRCTADVRSGRVNAQYQWGNGGFDGEYDRPTANYPAPPSWRNRSGNTPQGRIWLSGGIIGRSSGKGLDVQGRSTQDSANVQIWDFGGGPNQTWDVVDLGRGEFAIISQGSNKVLEVADGSPEDGGRVIQYRWNGGDNQRWRFERKSGGFYQIVNVGSGRCLDVQGQRTDNGANIQQWSCSGADNQAFRIQSQ